MSAVQWVVWKVASLVEMKVSSWVVDLVAEKVDDSVVP